MRRKRVLAAILAMLSVPVLLAATEAASFYAANRSNGFIVADGLKRDYVLYVPPSYDRTRPTPLVISMHGAGLWGAFQRYMSQWDRVADREGIIVVYPSAFRRGIRVWNMGFGPGHMRDVTFIAALIDTLSKSYNIDPVRVYANGLSNGGGMSFQLSCTMSDRIAAVGLVGAALLVQFKACTDTNPVPMIAFHGTDDKFAPYSGGKTFVAPRPFANIPRWTRSWARRNRCAPNPTDSSVTPDVVRRQYTHCANDATVVLYTVQGGGHTWPGGGPMPEWFLGRTTYSIDASSVMWQFFREHPLRRK